MNRRINNGNDSAENFERTIQFHLLSAKLQKELNLKVTQPKRISSSGVKLAGTKENIVEMPIIQ